MKKILILILTVCSIVGYGQIIMPLNASNTPANINTAISMSVVASGTNTYTATITSATYVINKAFTFTFTNANSGSSTININNGSSNLGAITLKKFSSGSLTDLESGDILAGQSIRFRYNGTYFVMEGGSGSGGGTLTDGSGTTANGTAVDLGGTQTSNAIISGAGGNYGTTFDEQEHFTVNVQGGNDANITVAEDGNANITSNSGNINLTTFSGNATNIVASGTGYAFSVTGAGILMNFNSDATGDLPYRASSGYLARRGIGTSGQILTVSGGVPVWANPATNGTVTSVTSANGDATVANTTTTPVITIVSAPKWSSARNLAGNSVDGSANVAFANKFIVQGTTDAGLSGAQFLGALNTGLVKNTTTTGVLSIAAGGTDYEFPLTFSTGLTRSTNTITVNTSQNISTLSNLTTNGFVTTSGGTGALSVTVPGTGVSTWIVTPSWTNLTAALTGTAPFWNTTGSTTVTTPTITGKPTWTQSSESATNIFQTFTQAAHTGGSPVGLLYTGGAHTTIAVAEFTDFNLNASRTVNFASGGGTIANERIARIQAPTLTATTNGITITKAATLAISDAPTASTNVTITQGYALDIEAGKMKVGSFTPPGTTLTAAIQTSGEVRATGGFNLRNVTTNDNAKIGFFINGTADVDIYANAAATLLIKNIGSGATGGAYVKASGTLSPASGSAALTSAFLSSIAWQASGGTNSFSAYEIDGVVNTSGTWAGDIRGFYYHPTLTGTTGLANNYAFLANSGKMLLNGTTITASTELDIRGTGTTSSTINTRWANSSNTALTTLTDDGNWSIAGNVTLNTVGNKISIKEGSGGFMGQTTLVAGTKAVTVSGVTTSTRCLTTLVTPNTTAATVTYQCVCTANTVTLQANIAAGTINTADVSTLNYILFEPAP